MNWYLVVFLALAVVLTAGVGPLVKRVLDEVTRRYKKPDAFETEDWKQYVNSTDLMLKGGEHSGWILGNLERLLFVTAIWQDAMLLIPSWLVVKVATKWHVWSGFLAQYYVKSEINNATTHGRRYLSWRLSQRFLIGSLLNVLLAFAIYGASYVIACNNLSWNCV